MGSKEVKIKLVQVIAESSAVGGGPKHILGLLENINKEKFETYLICPKGELTKETKKIKKVETIEIEMGSKFNIGAILRIKKALQKIQGANDPFGPMIVHSHGPRGGLLARKALPAGAISVYTEHIWGPGYHLEDRVNEWAQKKTLRALNNKTNLIIAVSSAVKKFLVEEKLAPEERIIVIPNGITIGRKLKVESRKLSKQNYQSQIIGTVGSLNQVKGQKYLVSAMVEVIKQFPHAMLEIVGEGEEKDNLKSQISNLKLERHITLLGKRTNVEEIMAKWSVFVLPSVAETFGITILEAYAVGIPVIASKISGISDLVTNKKTGILVEAEDKTAIANAIVELLNHPAEAAKLVRGGKERVKDYDWGKVALKLESEYIGLTTSKLKS